MNMIDMTGDPIIAQARAIFLDHYKDAAFLARVTAYNGYWQTGGDTGAQIAGKIQAANLTIHLKLNPERRNENARTVPGLGGVQEILFNPDRLNINTNPYVLAERIDTLAHEFMHCIGYQHRLGFPWYAKRTVPGRVGEFFAAHVRTLNLPGVVFPP